MRIDPLSGASAFCCVVSVLCVRQQAKLLELHRHMMTSELMQDLPTGTNNLHDASLSLKVQPPLETIFGQYASWGAETARH